MDLCFMYVRRTTVTRGCGDIVPSLPRQAGPLASSLLSPHTLQSDEGRHLRRVGVKARIKEGELQEAEHTNACVRKWNQVDDKGGRCIDINIMPRQATCKIHEEE
eukprot:467647-Prorocentrum_minimum.AAC.3